MNNALALAGSNTLAITHIPALQQVFVKPAGSISEIRSRIEDASVSVSDIGRYLKAKGKELTRTELKVINYALARARYRENLALSIEHVALLAGLTVEKARRYYKRLQIEVGTKVTNMQASALMSAVADYS